MFEGMSLMNPEFLQVQTFMWIIIDRFLGSVLLLTLPRKGGTEKPKMICKELLQILPWASVGY